MHTHTHGLWVPTHTRCDDGQAALERRCPPRPCARQGRRMPALRIPCAPSRRPRILTSCPVCLPQIVAPCCAQFLVTRRAIQKHPREFYEETIKWMDGTRTDKPELVMEYLVGSTCSTSSTSRPMRCLRGWSLAPPPQGMGHAACGDATRGAVEQCCATSAASLAGACPCPQHLLPPAHAPAIPPRAVANHVQSA